MSHSTKSKMNKKKQENTKVKLHGVMTESMVEEQVQRSGTYPFTFTSSVIICIAAFLGCTVFPKIAMGNGLNVAVVTIVSTSILLSLAVAYTRYFIDSKRGYSKGFWYTLAATFVGILLVLCLLFYKRWVI